MNRIAMLLAVPAVSQAAQFEEVRTRLDQVRSLSWQLSDAALSAATLDRNREPDRAAAATAQAAQLLKDARDVLAWAREALAAGVRTGEIGPETEAQLRRVLDGYERDCERARQRLEENLNLQPPQPPPDTPPADAPPEPPPVAAPPSEIAPDELRALRTQIDVAIGSASRYEFGRAAETLDEAFRAAGLEWARRYCDSWGGGLYTSTINTLGRHGEWRSVFQEAISTIEAGESLDPRYAGLLRQEVLRWRTDASQVEEICELLVGLNVSSATILERIHDCQEERYAGRITPEQCDARCTEENRTRESVLTAMGRAQERLRTEDLLAPPPPSYHAWRLEHPPLPTAPEAAVEPGPTDPERFRAEAERMMRRLEERLSGRDSLMSDFDHIEDVATSFDSRSFTSGIWDYYDFEGRRMIGGEVNYYFQGMFWRRVGVPPWVMCRIIDAWNFRGDRTIGNRNQYHAARAGWNQTDAAMRHPDGPAAYFASDAYQAPEIRHVGRNPNREVPGNADLGFWP